MVISSLRLPHLGTEYGPSYEILVPTPYGPRRRLYGKCGLVKIRQKGRRAGGRIADTIRYDAIAWSDILLHLYTIIPLSLHHVRRSSYKW